MFRASAYANYIPRRIIFAALLICATCSIECSGTQPPILAPRLLLSDGNTIPVVGLGTGGPKSPDDGIRAIKDAIDIGYRHIDTAYVYNNEQEVGAAIHAKIADGTVKRADIFVTTKLWGTFHEPEWVDRQFEASLKKLNLTYVDLYLIHAPVPYPPLSKVTNLTAESVADTNLQPRGSDNKSLTIDVDYLLTWRKLEQLVASGRVKSIGLSNFNSEQVSRVIQFATIKPVINQIECHANFNQLKYINYLKERGVATVCYSPLGRPSVTGDGIALNHPNVLKLAAQYKKSPAQIVLRFAHQNGAIAVPKSTKKHRQHENIDIFDFALTDDEMQTVRVLNTNLRIITFKEDVDSKYYPFNIEF